MSGATAAVGSAAGAAGATGAASGAGAPAGASDGGGLLTGQGTPGGGTGGAAAGGAGASFLDSLPADIRGDVAFKDIKDVGALAKAYLHGQKLIGRDPTTVLALPAANDDNAAWDAVYARLGRPDKPDGYQLADVAGFQADAALRDKFLDTAHKAGLSARQANALYAWYGQANVEAAAASAAQQRAAGQAAVTALRQEWGQAFDEKTLDARTAVRHYGGDALVALLDQSGLGDNPVLARAFAQAGAALREAKIVGGESGQRSFSPAEARQQINTLQADKAFVEAYRDPRNPGHKDAVARMSALYGAAFPPE